MATRIGSAFFDVTFNTAAARREVTALVSTANRQFGLIGGIGLVAATIGVAAVTRSVVEMGGAALGAANEYETAFTSVRKTLDTAGLDAEQAEKTFGRLSDQLRDLALITPLDLEDDLTAVAALGGQLGIAAEDIKEFTQVISEVGVTTNVAVEDAAISFARVANIMGIPESQFRDFGDTLIHLGNNLATREDEILNFSLRIAAAGDIAGFTSDEVLALSASMSAVGVPAERGGTAVQRVLIEITEAVAEAGDKLDLFAQVSGMTSEQFATAWETNAGGAFVDFVEGLGASGDDAFTILDQLDLANLRTVQSFLSLANAGPLLRDSFELASESAEALATESSLFFGTTESNVQLLANAVNDARITIGEPIQDPFNDIVDSIRQWIALNPELATQIGTNLATALENLEPVIIRLIDLAANFVESWTEFFASEPFQRFADDSTEFLQRGFASTQEFAEWERGLAELFDRDNPVAWFARNILFGPGAALDFVVDDVMAQLTLVEGGLRDALEGGADPVDALVDSFVNLEDRLEPFGQKISELGFRELINEVNLTEDELRELFRLLQIEGVELPPGVLPAANVPGGIPGQPDLPRAIIDPFRGRTPFEQLELEFLDLAEAEAAAIEEAELFAGALDGVRDAADDLNLPISVLLDNMRLLPPDVQELVNQFGAAEVEAALFAQALQGLEDAIEFDTGNAVHQIDVLTGAVEETNTSVGEMFDNAEEALNQLANFEARKATLATLGLDNIVELLEELPFDVAVHAAEDFVRNLDIPGITADGVRSQGPDTIELDELLTVGGELDEEVLEDLRTALRTGDITPELLVLAQQFSSDAVQQEIANAGNEDAMTFGESVQFALDNLGIALPVDLEVGDVDPILQWVLEQGGAIFQDIITRPGGTNVGHPGEVVVNIHSSGTTSGDAARAGQAINNAVYVD